MVDTYLVATEPQARTDSMLYITYYSLMCLIWIFHIFCDPGIGTDSLLHSYTTAHERPTIDVEWPTQAIFPFNKS